MSIITITRKWETSRSTISQFQLLDAVEGELRQGYFLERPGPDTKESGLRLRIPEGTYQLRWQTRTGLAGIRSHLPVPWLFNETVPLTRSIYIHNGNHPENTDGCLLIGRSHADDFVGSSVESLQAFKRFLDRVGIDKVQIRIISDFQ